MLLRSAFGATVLLGFCSLSAEAFVRAPPARRIRPVRGPLMSAAKDETQARVEAATLRPGWTPADDGVEPTFFDKVWRNCDAAYKFCLGNALDDPNYRNGVLASVGLTLLFSSNHPALHSLYTSIEHSPPVPLLNAGAAAAAAIGMVFAGSAVQDMAPCKVEALADPGAPGTAEEKRVAAIKSGMELGLWKTLAATLNLLGLAITSASHGAFLIQLTTIIVPLVQGLMGIPIARQIWAGVVLAMTGLYLFTHDPTSAAQTSVQGDLLCVLSALFYSAYDLRVFEFGRKLGDAPAELVQFKVMTQAVLSVAIVVGAALWQRTQGGMDDVTQFFHSVTGPELLLIIPVMLWNGLIVNAAASVVQVGAVQAIGATRSQIIYATGPLWAALMSMATLGEKAGPWSVAGGSLFLAALLVAATAPPPEAVCNDEACEV